MTKIGDLEKEVDGIMSRYRRVRHDPKFHEMENYQYQIRLPNTRTTLLEWINENCQGDYSLDGDKGAGRVISFRLISDATLVKLTWGGSQ